MKTQKEKQRKDEEDSDAPPSPAITDDAFEEETLQEIFKTAILPHVYAVISSSIHN